MNNERERLVDKLNKNVPLGIDYTLLGGIADFILEDRKRIVEPLVKYKKEFEEVFMNPMTAIDKTLKLAGLAKESQ